MTTPGSWCSHCGLQIASDSGICAFHVAIHGDEWALSNRIWCDYFHRGVIPTRLPSHEREENVFYTSDTYVG